MSKIVTIDGGKIPDQKEVSEDCLNMLEKWTEMVEAGEITAICICGLSDGEKTVTTGISNSQPKLALMVGGLEIIKARLLRDID